MKTVRGLPMVTVEQCILHHETALEIEAQRDKLLVILKAVSEYETYETEYDGRIYSICNSCGAQDSQPHRESCDYKVARDLIAEVEATK
jgi:hypothetical protein